ncbi:hypothetical protein BDN70DRAFT_697357 [Pholiota conissans]|uniref:Uncharacterized protein n=1 Tax=Pholiota conissans TaxID=109636 RepID=A0A9P6D0F9_9AGAR|nr:hypothetical protein BDN70DRAFT_697357 [Pholiota conissans]
MSTAAKSIYATIPMSLVKRMLCVLPCLVGFGRSRISEVSKSKTCLYNLRIDIDGTHELTSSQNKSRYHSVGTKPLRKNQKVELQRYPPVSANAIT